jgi:hypothetical protein
MEMIVGLAIVGFFLLLLYFVIRAASNSRRVAELTFDAMTPYQQEQITAARVRRGNHKRLAFWALVAILVFIWYSHNGVIP